MQIVRTIVWVLILFGLLVFSFFNWDPVEVTLWDNFVLETKVPMLVLVAFLLGLLPMWLYHRAAKWNLTRRITSLENAVRSNALSSRHSPPPSAGSAETPPSTDPLSPDGN
ncbi:LapA family protein [Altererythrobacter sp. BO-6]|uniref:LapA family protein n=1 Tax=Altererythrobacter sp. BO-6 TaxID=2604537 RepID=UPI0013E152ED|nr:LapA family protein [Altererythrobacter sp. BO-6]QIG55208.1 LapA family protein [Altererythrobacter sp. BO-6]